MHALVCLVLVGTCLASIVLALRGRPLLRATVAVQDGWLPPPTPRTTRVILTAPKTSPPV